MKVPYAGAIDCDVHPAVPSTAALLPYLDEVWRDQFVNRHIDRTPFTLMSYPPNSPLSARPDWRAGVGLPGSDLDLLRKQVLDPFGTSIAILNPLHGAIALFNEDMSAALCCAVNDWIAKEWLDRDPRLRASILVAAQNPNLAVAEIERLAADRRFVQVLLPAMGDVPLGRRASLADLPGRRAARPRDRHPRRQHLPARADGRGLAVLPARGLCRAERGLREPDHQPAGRGRVPEIPRAQVRADRVRASPGCRRCCGARANPGAACGPRCRGSTGCRPTSCATMSGLTLQPIDAPADPAKLLATLEHIGSDRVLLFSTDYPHWHFDGEDVLPEGLPRGHAAPAADRQCARHLSALARCGGRWRELQPSSQETVP